jgi:hypothetical protein
VTVVNNTFEREERDYYRPRRRRQSNGLAIAGFVCAIVGAAFFCIPLLGGILGGIGVIFGGVSLAQSKRGSNGFAIASLVVGLVACILSFIMFSVYLHSTRY